MFLFHLEKIFLKQFAPCCSQISELEHLVQQASSSQRELSADAKDTVASLEAQLQVSQQGIEGLEYQLAETEAKLAQSLHALELLKSEFNSKEEGLSTTVQKLQFEVEQSKLSAKQSLGELQESAEQQEQVSAFLLFSFFLSKEYP